MSDDARSHNDIRHDVQQLVQADAAEPSWKECGRGVVRMLGLLVESNLFVVEAVDRLTASNNEHAGGAARTLHWFSDNLHSMLRDLVGRR